MIGSYGLLSKCTVAKLSSWYNFIIVLLPSLGFQANLIDRPLSVMCLLHCMRVSQGFIQAAAVFLSAQLPDVRSNHKSISWCLLVTSNLGYFLQGSAGVTIPGSVQNVWGCSTLGTWFRGGPGSSGLMVELGNIGGLSNLSDSGILFHDSICML